MCNGIGSFVSLVQIIFSNENAFLKATEHQKPSGPRMFYRHYIWWKRYTQCVKKETQQQKPSGPRKPKREKF